MPKVNVYLPDDLAEAVKDAGLPVSAICQRALEQAVRRITAIREVAAGSSSMPGVPDRPVINFTVRAMTVLRSAQATATADGLAGIGTGHMLRSLVAEDNMAVRVLGALEISPQQVRAELARQHEADQGGDLDPAAAGSQPAGDATAAAEAGFGPQAAKAVELAASESSGLGNAYLGCEHLLLGLIAEPDGTAGRALRALGADLRVTRRTVAAALAGWGAGFTAHEQRSAAQAGQTVQQQASGQGQAGLAGAPVVTAADQLAIAIKAELAPLLSRIERLERRAAR
jgi:ATP-dependent Clp protease ATP-binding subunit ClpA